MQEKSAPEAPAAAKLFRDFDLPAGLQESIAAIGYTEPTPIQARAIPLVLAGKDVIGCAQTGTGKTAAFCIPVIARLLQAPGKTALILVPTREIATQIANVVAGLTRHSPAMRPALLIGGMSMFPQLRELSRKPRIIVATPGRLNDHLQRRSLKLDQTEFLVLDEADRMLDMGFEPQLIAVLRHVPQQRRTMMFSATMAPEILKLAQKYLRDPVRVTVGAISRPVDAIKQVMVRTTGDAKNNVVIQELGAREGTVLIFARTKRRTDRLSRVLEEAGFAVTRIHGDRSQGQRNHAIEGFRNGRYRVLVATDIAARGIDIPHIQHVINYDLPDAADDFIHRIGRTARAGAQGNALSLVTPEDQGTWRAIARMNGIPQQRDNQARDYQPREAPRAAGNDSLGGRVEGPGREMARVGGRQDGGVPAIAGSRFGRRGRYGNAGRSGGGGGKRFGRPGGRYGKGPRPGSGTFGGGRKA